nr:zinc finger, CCHC-type [Tanacetum cinerariifolium]
MDDDEDASSKKFLVSNFTNYKVTDSRPVLEQYNELLGILGRFTQHKMNMDEAIQVNMDDPNITMEEYIRLEEEKAQKRRNVFNWKTVKYGKIWYDEHIDDLRSVETEFLAIAFNHGVSSEKTLSYEPTLSSLNNEIDFKISFEDSDDEDYTIIFDKNSFSY